MTAAFALLFGVSDSFLWSGSGTPASASRARSLSATPSTYASLVLVLGHLYPAVLHPPTRHALRGITLGSVDEVWARRQHAKWADLSRQAEPGP